MLTAMRRISNSSCVLFAKTPQQTAVLAWWSMIGGDNGAIRDDQPLSDQKPKAVQKLLKCALDFVIVLFADQVSALHLSAGPCPRLPQLVTPRYAWHSMPSE
jgi:hypothetical protein